MRGNLLLTGAITLVCLAALEPVVRLGLPYNPPLALRAQTAVQYRPSGLARFLLTPGKTVLGTDETSRLRTDRTKYRINPHGFRGPDFPLRPDPGEVRIVVVGGSHVFDIYSFDWEGHPGWPHEIEKALRERGHRVRVINAGTPGWSTVEALARTIFDFRRFRPHIVILNSEWNDLKWMAALVLRPSQPLVMYSPRALEPNPMVESVGLADRTLGWSFAYRKLRDTYWRRKLRLAQSDGVVEDVAWSGKGLGGNLAERLRDSFDQYEANLDLFAHAVRNMGALPVLAIEERLVAPANTDDQKKTIRYDMIPGRPTHDQLLELFALADDRLQRVAKKIGVPVFDVNREMIGRHEYFFDHIHTTPGGSHQLGLRYAELLTPHVASFAAPAALAPK